MKLETELISDFVDNIETIEVFKPASCSWESTEKEIAENNPYALWNDKTNKIQTSLWSLANFVWQIVETNNNDKNYLAARWHIVRGLASCTFWWASGRKISSFGHTAWNPDEVERGLNELIRAIRSLDDKKLNSEKIKAEKMCAKLQEMIWIKHWGK